MKNDALIFVNQEFERINDELKAEVEQNRFSSLSTDISNTDEDNFYNTSQLKKKTKTIIISKTRSKNKSIEAEDEAARVCKIF